MWKVEWLHIQFGPQGLAGTEADCRAKFSELTKEASVGDIEYVLLIDPNGNYEDTWGT